MPLDDPRTCLGQMRRHRCGAVLKTGRRISASTRPCTGSITRSCRRHLVRKTRATAVGYALQGRHPFQMQPLAFSACQVTSTITRGWSVTPVQQGFFGDDVSLTLCQECEAGHFSSTTRLTPCYRCLKGSFWVAKDVGCLECSPGQFSEPVHDHMFAVRRGTCSERVWSDGVPPVQPGA